MTYDPRVPYNDLPPLPPPVELETKDVLKKAISVGRALAELKGLGHLIPNQAMLVHSLVAKEAMASSEIENIVTTNDALFKAMATSSQVDPATKEVMRYRQAVWDGFNAIKKRPRLDTKLFIKLVQTIKEEELGIRTEPGTVIGNQSTREIVYTPPEGEGLIRDMLEDLTGFIHKEEDLDSLIKLALVHYQFEAIHPFEDGNGRTGRIINTLFLVSKGLLDLPVLYLSKYIIDNKAEYYRRIRHVTEKEDWIGWTLFMLDAVEETARITRRQILDIRTLLEETLEQARKKLPSRVYSKELIELIFRQPYTKGQFLVDAGIAERKTASEYLKALEDAGILTLHKAGRENLYLNNKLYDLLAT